ncbi:uncharacterized protein C8R40DRAFT_389430 [Lentinula edodes]|uniref:uncharacterized protein n=1 Tax=Lentinula edodes TaxID=5353 RepID=UPI001E8CE86A|nr:uncharacterized protein C8R40DRAFT_389430 [Lentinula edodes]KAH7873456.1 hypothetical protein C8R40DRAFT_389430 [Lentinula edodes]
MPLIPNIFVVNLPTDEEQYVRIMTILGNTMYIVSFVALAAILSTKLLNKRIKRTITWNFFIASWMLHCVTFFLSMGYQIGNSAPPFGLCLVQAGMLYATPAYNACVSLALLLHLHSIIVATVRGMNHSSSKRMRVLVWILLISPLVVYVTVLSMTFIMVAQDKSLLQRDQTFYFCNINDEVGIWTSSIIVFLCALAFITYEIYTIVILWKNSQTFRAMNPHSRDRIFRSIVIRIGVFTVFPVIALFLSVILSFSAADSWTPSSGMRINVVDASLPLACALIFGSQEDLLNVWMFWRESSPYRSTQHSQTHSSGPEHLRTGGRSRILLDPVVPRVGVKVSTTRIQDRDDGWASKSPVESDIELHKDVKVELL